jgi:hypothetical protein
MSFLISSSVKKFISLGGTFASSIFSGCKTSISFLSKNLKNDLKAVI